MQAILAACLAWSAWGEPAGLVGRWRLEGDCLDACARAADGINHGARLEPGGACFDGLDDWIQLPAAAFQPGKDDFTIGVWVFATYEGQLYAGTWPGGSVYVFDGKRDWSPAGRLGEEKEVMGVAVYNGKLYAGTLPLAQVYRYDGGTRWTLTGQLDRTPGVKYRRAWSMAVYQGKLFCGTLPSGHVYALEAGRCATGDRELPPGWHHVAAVKRGGRLVLYVDGHCAGQSSAFAPADYDLTNGRPLRIGFGPHDYFRGKLRDLRIYGHALAENEIQTLATSKP